MGEWFRRYRPDKIRTLTDGCRDTVIPIHTSHNKSRGVIKNGNLQRRPTSKIMFIYLLTDLYLLTRGRFWEFQNVNKQIRTHFLPSLLHWQHGKTAYFHQKSNLLSPISTPSLQKEELAHTFYTGTSADTQTPIHLPAVLWILWQCLRHVQRFLFIFLQRSTVWREWDPLPHHAVLILQSSDVCCTALWCRRGALLSQSCQHLHQGLVSSFTICQQSSKLFQCSSKGGSLWVKSKLFQHSAHLIQMQLKKKIFLNTP